MCFKFLSITALLCGVTLVRANEPPDAFSVNPPNAFVEKTELKVEELKYDAKGACVTIQWRQWAGCGVCIASEGGKSLVVSCNHIFDATDAGNIGNYPLECVVTTNDKKTHTATALSGDLGADSVVILVNDTLPVAAIADSVPAPGTKVWRNGMGSGYQTGKIVASDPNWVMEKSKFEVDSHSVSGDSGSGYFTEKNELVAIHNGRNPNQRLARGTSIIAVTAVVKSKAPFRLFPRLRDRIDARRNSNAAQPMALPEPPATPSAPQAKPPAVKVTEYTVPGPTYYLPSATSSWSTSGGTTCSGPNCNAGGGATYRSGIFGRRR